MSVNNVDNKMLFSVIIPIYKGNVYIRRIVKMIESNHAFMKCKGIESKFEIIFVNDYPEEKLDLVQTSEDDILIKGIESEINRGIHGARCLGLQNCKGEYILFFDQDDILRDNFFYSQWMAMGNCDLVVCNGVNHKRKMIYSSRESQKRVLDRKVYLSKDNPIVSPGQVILRRNSIPEQWTKYILQNNGADDYFLWLLIVFTNKKIATNFENVYTHTVHGSNTSKDSTLMDASRKEMFMSIKKCKVLNFFDLRKLERIIMQ